MNQSVGAPSGRPTSDLGAEPRRRVVFFIGFLGLGGSERQLFLLLNQLDLERYEPHVVVFNTSPNETYEEPLRSLGVEVWAFPSHTRGIVQRLTYLHRLLRRLQPDVLHSWTFHDNVYAGVLGRLLRVPVAWGSLRNAYNAREVQTLPALFRLLALYGVSRIVVNAPSLKQELRAVGLADHRIHVLPNCVEPASEGPAPDLSDLGVHTGHQLVGIVGNLRRQKNHLLFVDAMAEVVSVHPNARGIIIGQALPENPGVREEIAARIEAIGLTDRIIVAGFRSDAPDLMKRLDALVLSSDYEGMPNVVLEAMAAGRPVVATDVGAIRDLLVDGVTGFVVPPGNATMVANRIDQLLRHPSQARIMGLRARRVVEERHDCRQAAALLEQLYERALTETGSPHTWTNSS